MVVRSLVRGAGVFALSVAGLGLAAPALASSAANAATKDVDSACIEPGGCGGFAGYHFQTGDYGPAPSVIETTNLVVPKLRCGSADQAIAPNFGAYVGDAGRPSTAALFVGCHAGKAHYWPELALKGSIKNYPTKAAHAGDTIVLRLAYDHTSGSVSVVDETHKFKVSRTGDGIGGGILYAWIGDEGWADSRGRLERVPDFGTLTYLDTKFNGHPLDSRDGALSFAPRNRTSHGKLQIKTGPFFPGGKAFRTYFRHF